MRNMKHQSNQPVSQRNNENNESERKMKMKIYQ